MNVCVIGKEILNAHEGIRKETSAVDILMNISKLQMEMGRS